MRVTNTMIDVLLHTLTIYLFVGVAVCGEMSTPMFVIKRDGSKEQVMFDKITRRVSYLCQDLDHKYIDPVVVAQGVVTGLYAGVTTSQLDNLAAETAAYMSSSHPDYAKLAARIAVSNLQKDTLASFSSTMDLLFNYVDPKTNLPAGIISQQVYTTINNNRDQIDAYINHTRDFNFDYFGFKTLEKSYLLKLGDKVVERPQYLFMRVALGIHQDDIEAAFETYDLMSEKWFIHASPTLFHSGTPLPQLSSCFLLNIASDSIEGIYDTLHRCALISKSAGGIGLSVQNIRAKGSYIRGTKGYSNGLVPMLRVFDATARYVDQGGGKRPGAFAVYLEPWHADIFEFLDLKKNTGKEESRARDLFFGLWIPDLFMKRVEEGGQWSLMCPAECPGLDTSWGAEFEALYTKYETAGKARKTIPARELWYAILTSQIETGTPYMLYKDACNSKSNQQNLGTIKCSNLCTEIIEYTAPDEVAVCNLASVVLPKFVCSEKPNSVLDDRYIDKIQPVVNSTSCIMYFNHERLYEVVKVMTRNLNKIIDVNYYPIEEARRSNMRHRPIGIGVQGLADVFQMLKLPFESDEAKRLNKAIFETIYFASVDASCELAEKTGCYETFTGSPASKGQLQFDLWNVKPSSRWDWEGLKARIKQSGLKNSLLVAPMPTASTAQIMGNNECFEPYTSNLYVRRVRAGEFIVVNPHLLSDLTACDLWTKEVRNQLIANGGSIANINEIPAHMKDIYKTVWEIKQKSLIDMAVDRGAFIDQSQSLNLFVAEPDFEKLTSMHFYSWKRGLKTGMYYLRTKAASQAIQFTVDAKRRQSNIGKAIISSEEATGDVLSKEGRLPVDTVYGEACISCSG